MDRSNRHESDMSRNSKANQNVDRQVHQQGAQHIRNRTEQQGSTSRSTRRSTTSKPHFQVDHQVDQHVYQQVDQQGVSRSNTHICIYIYKRGPTKINKRIIEEQTTSTTSKQYQHIETSRSTKKATKGGNKQNKTLRSTTSKVYQQGAKHINTEKHGSTSRPTNRPERRKHINKE